MERFNQIEEVLDFLESVPKFSHAGQSAANFNLGRMYRICSAMGNPQERFQSIHVAGTNGKGTVCRMLASVYREAGFKTALYTSPHLISVIERFKVNGDEISPGQMLTFFQNYGEMLSSAGATYFEITTAIAFWYFAQESVDIAILETGLGGRLDATNVVDPLASVITSIGKDHTDILGETLAEIAAEKGGIIKKMKPVFTGQLHRSAQSVIQKIADQLEAPLHEVIVQNPRFYSDGMGVQIHGEEVIFRGMSFKPVDAFNVCLVFQVVTQLNRTIHVDLSHFVGGIETMNQKYPVSAVFEKLRSDQNWYFDGAHNEDAVSALIDHLSRSGRPDQWTVVLSFMADKLSEPVAALWNRFPNIYLYEMELPRAADMNMQKGYFPDAKVFKPSDLKENNHFKSGLVIFSGSFYFYSTVREWMGTMTVTR